MKNSLNESSPSEGLPGTEAWKMCQSPDLRFWLHLLGGEDPAFKSGLYLVGLNHNQDKTCAGLVPFGQSRSVRGLAV